MFFQARQGSAQWHHCSRPPRAQPVSGPARPPPASRVDRRPTVDPCVFARRPGMRNDAGMRCDVAREALSARLDGERPRGARAAGRCPSGLVPPVPHVADRCGRADSPAGLDRARARTGPGRQDHGEPQRGVHRRGNAGCARCGRATGGGGSSPSACSRWRSRPHKSADSISAWCRHTHGAMSGEHLMHESTAWLLALGLAMIAAGVLARRGDRRRGDRRRVFGGTGGLRGGRRLRRRRAPRHASPVTCPCWWASCSRCWWRGNGSGHAGHGPRTRQTRPTTPRLRLHRPTARASVAHQRDRSTTTRRRPSGPAELRWLAMTASSDDEAVTALALAAARGNERALEAFIKATQRDVWRFVSYLCDAGNADDLTQETFLRAIGAIERFGGRSSARTWLLAIARRVVADHIRHAQSRPRTAAGAYPEHLTLRRPPRPRVRRPGRSDHDDRRAEHRTAGSPAAHPVSGAPLRRRRGGVWLPGGHHPFSGRPRP